MQIVDHLYSFPLETEYFGEPRVWHLTGVETKFGLILFDVGGPGDEQVLEPALQEDGFSLSDVSKVVATHQDLDHVGSLAEVVDRSGAEVVSHKEAAPYIDGSEPMLKRPESGYQAVPVDLQLTDGERFASLAGPFEVVFTPGHAPGHIALYFEDREILVSGDMLRSDRGFTGPKESVTPDMKTARKSLERLAELSVDKTICFHGGPTEAGTQEIKQALDKFPV